MRLLSGLFWWKVTEYRAKGGSLMRCLCGRTQFSISMSKNAVIAHCKTCADASWVMSCNCGGPAGKDHVLGEEGCFREKVLVRPRRISGEEDRWFVDNQTITGFTLRQQRGYHLHDDGHWSRPKDHESTNSLPDET